MRKFTIFNLIVVLFAIFFLGSCEYATITPDIPTPPAPGDSTSFSLEVQPIFTQSCVGCHNGTTNPDLREGKSYQSLMTNGFVVAGQPESSILYTCLQPGGVMSTYGSVTKNTTIKYWIQEGAKNN